MPRPSRKYIMNLSEEEIAKSLDRHYAYFYNVQDAEYIRGIPLQKLLESCRKNYGHLHYRDAFISYLQIRHSY